VRPDHVTSSLAEGYARPGREVAGHMPDLRLIHTSDFHDRLTPEEAARLRALKAEHGALLIDTGDAIRAANVTVLPWRERAISLMNDAEYDAMGLGNREFFFRAGGMAWKTGHARFPRLAANLQGVDGITPWTLLTAQGVRIALISLMPTMIAPGHGFERVSNARFRQWQAAVGDVSVRLLAESDLVVALFHRPNTEIEEFCAILPDTALVLAGHDHVLRPTLEAAPSGQPVSYVGEGATHARVIGLRSDDRNVTMDRLIELD
jgi:2',3'-cyclic-nucleotide 2'-phosphodiesterase (5'-nucleotidase family)